MYVLIDICIEYMNWWLSFILFVIILFLYIHIQTQYKKVVDVEIYEYDYESKTKLFNVCKWKLPIIFSLEVEDIPDINYFDDLLIRDVRQYLGNPSHVHSTKLSYDSGINMLNTETNGILYSDRNTNSINSNSAWSEWFSKLDNYLLPEYNVSTINDVIIGSINSKTLTCYHKNNYTFLYLPKSCDTVKVRLHPYNQIEFINPSKDKLYNEYYSQIDLFDENSKITSTEIILQPGFLLYIPSYWFYSIQFTGKHNIICKKQYSTAINYLANLKDHIIHFLQLQDSSISKPNELKEVVVGQDDTNENDEVVEKTKEQELLENIKK